MPMLAVVCVLLALHLGDALSGFFMQGFLLFLLGSAVAWIPLVTVLQNPAGRRSRASAELQGLVRLFLVVLAIEAAALIGNYH